MGMGRRGGRGSGAAGLVGVAKRRGWGVRAGRPAGVQAPAGVSTVRAAARTPAGAGSKVADDAGGAAKAAGGGGAATAAAAEPLNQLHVLCLNAWGLWGVSK